MKEHPLADSDPIAAVAAEVEAGGDPVALVRPAADVKLRGYSRPQVDQAVERYLEQLA